jgi:hypothetical protein
MIVIKKNIARRTAKAVDRTIRISKGINHDSIFIVVELMSNIVVVSYDVSRKIFFVLILEKHKKKENVIHGVMILFIRVLHLLTHDSYINLK